jgi:metal-dependent amidase/aminoacylase/carboxypeptidase family protein
VRTFDAGVRTRVLAAIERIAKAEAAASGAPRPPEITTIDQYPLNVNNRDGAKRVVDTGPPWRTRQRFESVVE